MVGTLVLHAIFRLLFAHRPVPRRRLGLSPTPPPVLARVLTLLALAAPGLAVPGLVMPGLVHAQGIEAAHRPIAEIRLSGLDRVSEQLVRNQIRSEVGAPYDPDTVEQDIVRLTHLGRFSAVSAEVTPKDDGSVILTFVLNEQPLLADVQVVGNKAISDQNLLSQVQLRAGDPIDPFLIDRGEQRIVEAYEDKGYFVADVNVDQTLLDESNILIFRIREGPRVHIREIRFQGNATYTAKQLDAQIKSDEYFPIFSPGELSREQLELDAASVRDFYRKRGYLDAEVGRRIDLSPDQQDAVVTFVIKEGPQYTVANVDISGNDAFSDAQIRRTMTLKRGDVFSQDAVDNSQQAIEQLYGKLGHMETQVQIQRLFHGDEPKVDLVVNLTPGASSRVGKVTLRGNALTQDKVILRQVRGMTPGRPYDREGVDETRRRLNESPLFSEAKVTVLGESDDRVRDVLIEVTEQSTGSLNFGAGVSSDAGVIGAITLTQRNFDLTDYPESPGEFFTGQAFRGAGQYFSLNLQPGSEVSRYSVSWREPYLFETDYFLDTNFFYFERLREDYDEERLGARLGIGQRFGDVWSASVRTRFNQVDISDIDSDAPVDVFNVQGDNMVTGLGFELERNTTDSSIFPTEGSKWTLGLERVGALGGDFDFTRARTTFQQFWTVDEDFFGRETVLSARAEVGYIFEDNEAPIFERFYAGGHRTFRGFDFRGVGPRGIRNDTGTLGDDAVGGDWLLLTGLQYNVPLYQELLRGVLFTDMGTVQEDLGLDNWRVSVGAGVRIKVPFFGQAPFALDFAFPVLKEEGDEERIFSFDLAVPLR